MATRTLRRSAPIVDPLEQAQRAFDNVQRRKDTIEAELAAARSTLAQLEKALAQRSSEYAEARATRRLDGGPEPSRQALTAAETAVRDAEGEVRALERRRAELDDIVRAARKTLLDRTIAALYAQVAQAEQQKEAAVARRWAATQEADALAHQINARLARLNEHKRALDALNREA
jgi:chromosome segregation ATPase